MRKVLPWLLVLLLVALVFLIFLRKNDNKPGEPRPPKEQPLAVSKYSDSFKLAVNTILENYYTLSEGFVNWDSGVVQAKAKELSGLLDNLSLNEIRKDTLIYETASSYQAGFKSDLETISVPTSGMEEKRRSFHSFSQNLFDLLRTIRFDAAKVYVQECPMAFNDNEAAIWLSKTPQIRNPYLGLHHPRYKSGMIDCGETKDSLRFGVAAITPTSGQDEKK